MIDKLLKDCVPSKTTNNSRKQPWITDKAKKLSRQKYRWFKKLKTNNSPRVLEQYLLIKKQCKQECRKAKSSYLDKLSDPSNNNKLFWSYVKSKKKDNISNNFLKDDEGQLQNKPDIKGKIFNTQFASVMSSQTDQCPSTIRDKRAPDITRIDITVDGVQKLMANLDPHKAIGPDKIPPYLLKELAVQ